MFSAQLLWVQFKISHQISGWKYDIYGVFTSVYCKNRWNLIQLYVGFKMYGLKLI